MTELTISAHGRTYRIGDIGSGVIGRALRAGNPYEPRVLEHIYRRGLQGLALDIGAHVGNHTLWLAAICGLKVIAVEPITHEELQSNIDRNALGDQVTAWPFALGDHDRTAGNAGKGRIRGTGEIPVHRLDALDVPDRVVLMKVDVEGMEPEVLAGGRDLISRDRPLIYAEAWDQDAHTRLAELLEPLGYRHTKTFGATPLEEWEWSPSR